MSKARGRTGHWKMKENPRKNHQKTLEKLLENTKNLKSALAFGVLFWLFFWHVFGWVLIVGFHRLLLVFFFKVYLVWRAFGMMLYTFGLALLGLRRLLLSFRKLLEADSNLAVGLVVVLLKESKTMWQVLHN